MNKIKLLASDLDGTLLNNQRELSPYTISVLNNVLEKDCLFIPCTSRTYSELPCWFKNNKKIEYIICSNGSIITNTINKILIENSISTNLIEVLLDVLTHINNYWTLDIEGILYSSIDIIKDKNKIGINEKYLNKLLFSRIFINDYHSLLKRYTSVRKLHFRTYQGKTKNEIQRYLANYNSIQTTSSHIDNLEITDINASKGVMLQYIMKINNISSAESIAFGDNENDITMFNAVNYKICVNNATDSLKVLANNIISSNNEDGVAHFIDSQLLKKL